MATVRPLKSGASGFLDEGASLRLCEAILRWRYDALPREVVGTLKFLILDALGVIAGAANAPGIPQLNERLSRW